MHLFPIAFLFLVSNDSRGVSEYFYKNRIYLTVNIDKHNTKIKYSWLFFSPKSRKIIYIDDVRLLAITSCNTPGFIKKSDIVICE